MVLFIYLLFERVIVLKRIKRPLTLGCDLYKLIWVFYTLQSYVTYFKHNIFLVDIKKFGYNWINVN